MKFSDIYLVSRNTSPLAPQEFNALEDELGVKFFNDLYLFYTSIGPGIINDYIVIPNLSGLKEFFFNWPRVQTLSSWDWSGVSDISICEKMFYKIGSTVDNDGLYFCPDSSKKVYLFPRQDWHVKEFTANLPRLFIDVLEQLGEKAHPLFFKSFVSKRQKEKLTVSGNIDLLIKETTTTLKGLDVLFSHEDEEAYHYFNQDSGLHIWIYPIFKECALSMYLEVDEGSSHTFMRSIRDSLERIGFNSKKSSSKD